MVTNYEKLFGDLPLPTSNSVSQSQDRGTLEDSLTSSGLTSWPPSVTKQETAESDEEQLAFVPVVSSQQEEITVAVTSPEEVQEEKPVHFDVSALLVKPMTPEEERAMSPRRLVMRPSKRHNQYAQQNTDDAPSGLESTTSSGTTPPNATNLAMETLPIGTPEYGSPPPTARSGATIPSSWPPRTSTFRAGGVMPRGTTPPPTEENEQGQEMEERDSSPRNRVFPPPRAPKPGASTVRCSSIYCLRFTGSSWSSY